MTAILRVGSRYGPIFDTPVAEGFNLDAFVHDVRSKGFYFNGAVYIPHEAIAFITLIPAEATDSLASQFAMGPQGQTRQ